MINQTGIDRRIASKELQKAHDHLYRSLTHDGNNENRIKKDMLDILLGVDRELTMREEQA